MRRRLLLHPRKESIVRSAARVARAVGAVAAAEAGVVVSAAMGPAAIAVRAAKATAWSRTSSRSTASRKS